MVKGVRAPSRGSDPLAPVSDAVQEGTKGDLVLIWTETIDVTSHSTHPPPSQQPPFTSFHLLLIHPPLTVGFSAFVRWLFLVSCYPPLPE